MAINKVVYGNTTLIDLTDTTATASDVLAGKYFYTNAGVKTEGTGTGGGGGAVWQDQDGYVHLSPDGSPPITVESLSVTQNGTYTAPTGKAYSPVTVNVSGGDTLIYSAEVTSSTTSTSQTLLATLNTGLDFGIAGKSYAVVIRDKAGKRNGYFYGCNQVFTPINSTYVSDTVIGTLVYGVDSDGAYNRTNSARGVYLYRFYKDGDLAIYERYDSARGTIDGTYTIKVYELGGQFGLE